jgi:hypothetical protein
MTTKFRTVLYAAALLGGTAIQATPAFAQATRTWVSGVGDDVNPCSRTAPCKTFAGAISKTANGGEINCLDPGGFGAVTINKTLVIDCHYTEGGLLAGGNGVVVNATSTDVVVLRGLDIFGVNPPTHGVRILVAQAVIIEDCVIRRFNLANSFGISFQPTATTALYINNSTISQNGAAGSGGGINIAPTGAGAGRVIMTNSRVIQNTNNGIAVNTAGTTGFAAFTVDQSNVSGNTAAGITATSGTELVGMITNSVIANNSTSGINSNGANTTLRVGNTTITGNASGGGNGVLVSSGAIRTYGDNRLDGNAIDGAFTAGTLPPH